MPDNDAIADSGSVTASPTAGRYPAMDGRRDVIVKVHKGETITAVDDFYVGGRDTRE